MQSPTAVSDTEVGDATGAGFGGPIVPVAYLADDASGWFPSLLSLREVREVAPLVVAGLATCDENDHVRVDTVVESFARLLELVASDPDVDWIVVAGEPCLAPARVAERLSDFVDERYATISFLSNDAGALSFPFVNQPVPWAVDGGTPDSITDILRSYQPLPGAVPVPIAAGPVVAFSAGIVRMLPPGWDLGATEWDELVARFALSAQARGLFNVLDTTTYVHRAADLRPLRTRSESSARRLQQRYPWVTTSLDVVAGEPSSPFRLDHALARIKISGLEVLLDGSCLGPTEMGTQVGLLAIAASLAERDDVANVAITLPQQMPAYARHLLNVDKISFVAGPVGGEIMTDRRFDVAFRPFQPDETFDVQVLRRRADRVMVSILDLIAYQNASYFRSGDLWSRYRRSITDALRLVDGVTTISHDVVKIVELERLPVSPERVFAVPYGTEHLDHFAPNRMPIQFESDPSARFLVCLGTNYGHKNRDTAIRALGLLRQRGHDLKLVLVGPAVPHGSSRALEAEAMMDLDARDVISMGSVSAVERNWLLAHAEAVLYPTTAEGFGLVPYEAAALDTPTIFFPFGPLEEIAGELPMHARDWSPDAFAEQMERLLADPALGKQQVHQLQQASQRSTWEATAGLLCDAFRSVLARPPMS